MRIGTSFQVMFGISPAVAIEKEFLLKFARDRRRYLHCFSSKEALRLRVLSYMLTSITFHFFVRNSDFLGYSVKYQEWGDNTPMR